MRRFEALRDILAEVTSLDPDQIKEESDFFDNLGLENPTVVDFFRVLETRFGFHIPEEDMPRITSLGSLIRYFKSKSN